MYQFISIQCTCKNIQLYWSALDPQAFANPSRTELISFLNGTWPSFCSSDLGYTFCQKNHPQKIHKTLMSTSLGCGVIITPTRCVPLFFPSVCIPRTKPHPYLRWNNRRHGVPSDTCSIRRGFRPTSPRPSGDRSRDFPQADSLSAKRLLLKVQPTPKNRWIPKLIKTANIFWFNLFFLGWKEKNTVVLEIRYIKKQSDTYQVIQSDLFIPDRWRSPTTIEKGHLMTNHHPKKVTFAELPGIHWWLKIEMLSFFLDWL